MKELSILLLSFFLLFSDNQNCLSANKYPSVTPDTYLSTSSTKTNLNNDIYHPFLNNSKWFTVKNLYEGYINAFSYFSGDTTVNDLLYSKLKYKFIKLPNLFNYIYATYNKTYQYNHYFREDIENKKVYILSWGKYESLFYDFGINEGDKLSSDTSFILTKTDTIKIVGGLRKRFTFETASGDNIIWIEGIGNISDPLSPTAIFQPYSKLYCAYQSDSLIYENCYLPDINCIDYSNIEAGFRSAEINRCNIYPNPTTGKFTIAMNDDALSIIKLYDMNGKLLKNLKCDLKSKTVSWDISNLLAGVYYCVIDTHHATETYKIIKY